MGESGRGGACEASVEVPEHEEAPGVAQSWASVQSYLRGNSSYDSRTTVYGTWWVRQEEWGNVTEHAAEEMDTHVLRDESEAV